MCRHWSFAHPRALHSFIFVKDLVPRFVGQVKLQLTTEYVVLAPRASLWKKKIKEIHVNFASLVRMQQKPDLTPAVHAMLVLHSLRKARQNAQLVHRERFRTKLDDHIARPV